MTRLTPPAQQARLLVRPRIDALLADASDYPLTLVVAPAGSGKTTALAGFVERSSTPTAWCRVSDDDRAEAFVRYLAAAMRPFAPEVEAELDTVLAHLPEHIDEAARGQLAQAVDALSNHLATALDSEVLLVVDDYQYADRKPIVRELFDYFLGALPQRLHILIVTREEPLLASLPISRARGEVHQINQFDLAFTVEEARALFDMYAASAAVDVAALTEFCRGWPLAVQMLVGTLSRQHRSGEEVFGQAEEQPEPEPTRTSLVQPELLDFETIFPLLSEYLRQQVFDRLSTELQDFLLRTAGLRWFDKSAYEMLPGLQQAAHLEKETERRRLFLERAANGRRIYQPIFWRFLEEQAQLCLDDRVAFHQAAADYYRTQDDYEGVIHHLLAVGEDLQATEVLEQVAVDWIKEGRASAVITWIGRLPSVQRQRPSLLEVHAAARRRTGDFEHAIHLYQQAEELYQAQNDVDGQVRTLRGRAEIYLDTVQPTSAGALLRQAFRLLPENRASERAEILRLQAENWANRGRADIALKLETWARQLAQNQQDTATSDEALNLQSLVPISTPLLLSRLMLRSGRLNEALNQLEADLGVSSQHELEQAPLPLAHREPSLLLAFVYTLLGKDARALAAARRGLLEAQQVGSELTEAIAYMRVGHAYQVVPSFDTATVQRHYEQASELVDRIGVPRSKVEVYMGLALLHGHSGDLGSAETVAQEGIKIAEESGDEWIAALIWLALGGAAVVVTDERAPQWLDKASQRFLRGGDTYGQAVVALWRALWHLRASNSDQVSEYVALLLDLIRKNSYEGLLTAPTLFGPRDLAMLIPILLYGRTMPEHASFAQQLLRQAFPSVASDEMVEDYHPGYTLHIQMLGNFRVWRGIREVQGREWQREKARQLLQLLLTYRGQWLQREQICSWLWPDSDLDAAERQFKVTLNALNTALEPFRPPRTMPFFVRRQGLAYSFAPSYGCWIDVDEFELRTTSLAQSDEDFVLRNSQIAVQLYKGDYLAESLYDSWTLEERERLMARYLATATMLAERLSERGEIQRAVQLCERVMRRDRCYEEVYQVLMRAYAQSGSRSQALRTYARCVQALQDELGIDPLPETTELYERIKRNERI